MLGESSCGRMLATMILVGSPCAMSVQAASPPPVFDHLEIPGGKAMNRVINITQDSAGFMWFGTDGGLVRYDGYEFRIYRHDDSRPGSLPTNEILVVYEDSDGTILVGTEDGMSIFDALAERFTTLRHDPDNVNSLVNNEVYDFHRDAAGNLWVATNGGLSRRVRGQDEFRNYRHDPAKPNTLNDDVVYVVFEDSRGRLWVGTRRGLNRYHPLTDDFERVLGADDSTISDDEVWKIHEDEDGNLWLAGTYHGLKRYTPETGELLVYREDPDDTTSIADDDVYAFLPDNNGRIWLGTYNGLDLFDPGAGAFTHFRASGSREDALRHPFVYDLFRDRTGIIWIATYGGGISRLHPDWREHARFTHDPNDNNSISGNNVQSVYVDPDGTIFVGTYNSGLNRIDGQSGEVTRYGYTPGAVSNRPRGRIWDILRRANGDLWVATSRGLAQMPAGANEFIIYDAEPDDPAGLPAADVWTLFEDSRGTLWAGVFAGGLVRFNDSSRDFTVYRHDPMDPNSLSQNDVVDIVEDDNGFLWVATFDGGVNRFDPVSGQFSKIDIGRESAARRRIHVLMPEGKLMWVGTRGGGLYQVNRDSLQVRQYNEPDNLPSGYINGILQDLGGEIWITTDNGLVRFDRERNRFKRYKLLGGMEAADFTHGAFYRDEAGTFYLGTSRGLMMFNPSRLEPDRTPPLVAITRVNARNQPVDNRRTSNALDDTETLVLDYRENSLSIEFAALHFLSPDQNKFAYRLEGVDDEWNHATDGEHSALYTNLVPGEYEFHVIASNPDDVWNETGRKLRIIVRSPPWLSATAFTVYFMFALLLLVISYWAWWSRVRVRRAFTRDLRESQKRLQLALWGSGDFLWDWDAQTGELYCGEFAEYLGYEFEKGTRTVDAMRRVIHPEDQVKVGDSLTWYLGKHDSLELEVRIMNSDGEWRWIKWRGRVVSRDEQGEPQRVTGTCKDITANKEAETELKLAATVMENNNDAVCIIDRDFRFVKVNHMFEQITGWKADEVIGEPSSILNSGRYDKETYEQIRATLQTGGSWSGELYEQRKNGEYYLSLLHLKSITDEKGVPTHYVGVFSDITRRRKSEEELRYLANYDSLTGLPNRTLFRERLAHAIIKSKRRNQQVAVLFVDLDNFKQVNDSLGHAVGDSFLRAAGARIAGCMREEDTVARLGGDEFTVIIEGISVKDHVGRIAQTILEAFQEPISVDQHRLTITPSIGISVFPEDGTDDMTLIQNADIAMYHAKNEGRNNSQFYTPAMSTTARDRLKLENDLRNALNRDQFVIHYQPKIDTETGKVCGVEALLRWDSPDSGLMYPGQFIYLAEERGLISRIGEWVLRRSCEDMTRLRAETGIDPGLAVNLSARQIREPGLTEKVKLILEEFEFPAHRLQLEITESLIMENATDSLRVLHELKNLGVQLVVDDFGTGYSSLSYLKRFPIDHIKIDKTFVQDLHHDDFAIAIITAIIAMASSLDLGVTAEGVETREQRDFLRGLGCRELQGYYFSRGIPFDELREFVRDNAPRRVGP